MSSQPNRGLADGLICLAALAASPEAIGGRELARRTGLHHVKVNRLLLTLAECGIVRQDERRRYLPAAGLHVLATLAMHRSGLLQRSRAPLAFLRRRLPRATFALGMLWQDQIAYLFHLRPGQALADGLGRTGLLPAEQSSIGQLLQAHLADPPTAAQRRIRRHGARLRHGPASQPHWSIAVPVFEFDQPIAGLAATNLPIDEPVDPAVDLLRQASRQMSLPAPTDRKAP